jgi:hypothetical protein
MGFYGELSVRGSKNGLVEQISHFPISQRFAETWMMPNAYTEDEMFNPNRKFDYYFRFEYDFLLEQLKDMHNFEDRYCLGENIKSIKSMCETIIISEFPSVPDLEYLQELIQDNLSAKKSFKREELEEVIQECREAITLGFTDIHVVYVGER